MSMAFCDCGRGVDTDLDCGFYYQELESGEEAGTEGLCAGCREAA